MIDIENLFVRFGHGASQVTAVRDASFSVREKESFGIVGESGSGKSTLLKVINGLAEAASGSLRICGQLQKKNPRKSFYKTVQMVFQDPYGSLHPRHTIDQILKAPLRIHRIGDADRRIAQAVSEVGLSQKVRFRYPHQLSGGQRQRIAIARAILVEPQVLLLDEPTSALDVSVQAEVLNLLSDLREANGLTFVMVSHDLAVVAHMCDRIAVMNQGEIVEILTSQQLRAGQASNAYTRMLIGSTGQLGVETAQAGAGSAY